MNKLMEELDLAYRLMSSVPVTGEAIDIISEARARLRIVHEGLKKMDDSEVKKDA